MIALKCLPVGWRSTAQHSRFRRVLKSKSLNLAPSSINATVTRLIIALLYYCTRVCWITGGVNEAVVRWHLNKLQLQRIHSVMHTYVYIGDVPLLFAATLHYFCRLLTCRNPTGTNGTTAPPVTNQYNGNRTRHQQLCHLQWQLALPATYLCVYNQSCLSLVALAFEGAVLF